MDKQVERLNKKLYWAACRDDVLMVNKFIKDGASVNWRPPEYRQNSLIATVERGHTKVLQILLNAGAKVNSKNSEGKTALHISAARGYLEIIEIFLKAKSSVNCMDIKGNTPLHDAAREGQLSAVNRLIKSCPDIDVNASNKQGNSPLHEAALNGHLYVTNSLISSGCLNSVLNQSGDAPIHIAVSKGHYAIANALIVAGCDVNMINGQGKTPLFIAVKNNKMETAESLLASHADINLPKGEGWTPLHYAAINGRLNSVEFLLNHRCDVNVKDSKGLTPLHYASWYGRTAIVDKLLQSNATLEAVDDEKNMTAYDLALLNTDRNGVRFNIDAKRRKAEVASLLKKSDHLKSVNNKDKSKKLPHRTRHVAEASDDVRNASTKADEILHHSKEDSTPFDKFPWIVDSKDFQLLLEKGTFESYENRVYLGGPCNTGKSTLASVLIDDEIPQEWHSTDGLVIFFGRNGIDLPNRKMIPLKGDSTSQGVLAKILLGNPKVDHNEDSILKPQLSNLTTESKKTEKHFSISSKIVQHTSEATSKKCVDERVESSKRILPDTTVKEFKKKESPERRIKIYEIKQYTVQEDIKNEVRKGKYKILIAPSDLIDFGGQKSFDMTHQLFILQNGSFVLMVDGRKGLFDILAEYPQGDITSADILKHWVNSILTYCGNEDDNMPMIFFVATHKDCLSKEKLSEQRDRFTNDIKRMFENHEMHNHIYLEKIFFINGLNKKDEEINDLTGTLVHYAFKQKSWGQRWPIAWVPLEMQLSKMRAQNIHIITKIDFIQLNEINEDLALSPQQLEDFLRVQHSIGKLMYFHHPRLDKYVIIHPPSLVNILRSFVTDKMFWPDDRNLSDILNRLTDIGIIKKTDLLRLWAQPQFAYDLPDENSKEFVIQILIYLDVLIEPIGLKTQTPVFYDFYLVPCTVKTSRPTDFISGVVNEKNTICLIYSLVTSTVPSALSFKLIGEASSIWPLKEENGRFCLYYKSAILSADDSNELRIYVEDNNVIILLTNKESKFFIPPDIAASIQECFTKTLEYCILFYKSSFGRKANILDDNKLFDTYVGIFCNSSICQISMEKAKKCKEWKCKSGIVHQTFGPLLWNFNKELEECPPECSGIDDQEELLNAVPTDKYLVRLASQFGIQSFREFIIHLGLTINEWENICYQYTKNGTLGIMFMSLHYWRNKTSKKHKPAIRDLVSAVKKANVSNHVFCKIFREDPKSFDIADSRLHEIPSNDVLNELKGHIGNCVIHLGIELGLQVTDVEDTMHNYPHQMYIAIFDILKKWKSAQKEKPTIKQLMIVLQRVDAGGLQFLKKKFLSSQ